MRFFYDTEFLENGRTIDLISIGIVSEIGNEYYAVNANMPFDSVMRHPWLPENVVPHLPVLDFGTTRARLDKAHPAVKSQRRIASEVSQFLLAPDKTELWADYAAYDHIVLMQLFGRMVDKPEHLPMFTHDLRQEYERLGEPEGAPQQHAELEHHALNDARHDRDFYQFLLKHHMKVHWNTNV